MVLKRVLWVTVFLACIMLYYVFLNPIMLVMAVVVLVLPLCSLVLNVLGLKTVEIDVGLPMQSEKNDITRGTLQIKNGHLIPIRALEIRLNINNQFTGIGESRIIKGQVKGRQQVKVEFEIFHKYCGTIELAVREIACSDCFGMIRVISPVNCFKSVCIIPNTFRQGIVVAASNGVDTEAIKYSQHKPGEDVTEIFDVREYQNGDALNRIHWKLTGKYDQLMVMRPGLPIVESILVMVNNCYENELSKPTGDGIDAMGESLASIVQNIIAGGNRCTVGLLDAEKDMMKSYEIEEYADFLAVLPKLLGMGPKIFSGGIETLLEKNQEKDNYAHIVIINGNQEQIVAKNRISSRFDCMLTNLTLGQTFYKETIAPNDERIFFTKNNYKEELYHLVI